MNKISVTIRAGKRSYTEELDLDAEKESWKECTTNGSNPDLEKMTFEDYYRPLKINVDDIEKYNSNHFIYGWFESFAQSDEVPQWMYESKEIEIEVKNE